MIYDVSEYCLPYTWVLALVERRLHRIHIIHKNARGRAPRHERRGIDCASGYDIIKAYNNMYTGKDKTTCIRPTWPGDSIVGKRIVVGNIHHSTESRKKHECIIQHCGGINVYASMINVVRLRIYVFQLSYIVHTHI